MLDNKVEKVEFHLKLWAEKIRYSWQESSKSLKILENGEIKVSG